MAVMEINLPSGFLADMDAIGKTIAKGVAKQHQERLQLNSNNNINNNNEVIKKIETQNNDTTIVVYFDRVSIYS